MHSGGCGHCYNEGSRVMSSTRLTEEPLLFKCAATEQLNISAATEKKG